MKRKFCCDASQEMYEDYYMRQTGRGTMPVYAGAHYQRGHGLGNIFSGLLRHVVPILKANAKNIAGNLLNTGMNVAGDVITGKKKLGQSLIEHVPQGIKRTAQDFTFHSDGGVEQKRHRPAAALA